MILDLTWVNKHIEYQHFKMNSLNTAKEMLRQDCWMGSIDLKDAYYSVLMHPHDRKFLRFRWKGILYQFKAMPNGISCAPYFFTKILNPVFAYLRDIGHETFHYIDDSFVVADTFEKCEQSIQVLCETVESLGFKVHPEKSVFQPKTEITFLGFLLNSREMIVTLNEDKIQKFKRSANDLLNNSKPTIREVAGLIGLMIAYSQAFNYAKAHIKAIESDKIQALRLSKGNFDVCMCLTVEAKLDIAWWLDNIDRSQKHILISEFDFELYTDASELGWGAHVADVTAGGRWTLEEQNLHINALEIKAILLALKSFCAQNFLHVKVYTDNTTAIAYIKNMGGVRSDFCNKLAHEIWCWCESHCIWLTIAHVPGVENVLADYKSRKFSDNVEWQLSQKIFQKICHIFGTPQVDLFATRLNNKLPKYVSWCPDPGACAIDAFTLNWSQFTFYAFPPFSCIPKVISKILKEGASGILIVPWWPTQTWWAWVNNLNLRSICFRPKKNNLVPIGNPNNIQFLNSCPLVAYRFLQTH